MAITRAIRPMRFGRNRAGTVRSWKGNARRALVLSALLSTAAFAQVPVDCDDASDFCTGNPCTVSQELEITVPLCDVDFATADLIVNEKIHVPNGGTLILRAASIDVNERIDGRHTKPATPDGADVSLIATGNITIDKRIDVSGRGSVGSITVDAGGHITLNRELRARAKGANTTAVGGTVYLSADGTLTTAKRGRTDVRGKKKASAAGAATLSGNAGAVLKGRVEARGSVGGSIVIVSTSGDVTIEEEMRGQGDPAGGGSVTVDAAGTIAVLGKKGKLLATGVPGGSIAVTAAGNITLNGVLKARGRNNGDGGMIAVASTAGDVDSSRPVDVKSTRSNGGSITFSGVNLSLAGIKEARGNSPGIGGTIEAAASNDLTASGTFKATPGGCIGFSAGGTLSTPGSFTPPSQVGSCP